MANKKHAASIQKDFGQLPLIGEDETEEWWEEYWQGMPEFVQEDLMPFKQILVNFENIEAVEAFAKLVCQTITMKTQYIWYPKAELAKVKDKRYIDES